MSEDILAQIQEELQPKTTKQCMIYLAGEIKGIHEDCHDMKELQRAQNGRVGKNAEAIARIQGQMSSGWKPQTRRGWFTGGATLLAIVTLAATFAGKLIEQVSWWP